MDAATLRTALTALNHLDRDDLIKFDVLAPADEAGWQRFRADPTAWFLAADSETQIRLSSAVTWQQHQPLRPHEIEALNARWDANGYLSEQEIGRLFRTVDQLMAQRARKAGGAERASAQARKREEP